VKVTCLTVFDQHACAYSLQASRSLDKSFGGAGDCSRATSSETGVVRGIGTCNVLGRARFRPEQQQYDGLLVCCGCPRERLLGALMSQHCWPLTITCYLALVSADGLHCTGVLHVLTEISVKVRTVASIARVH
jgi:hypothetical protein